MARDVTILSMNCRGLADVEKRNDVLHYLKKKNYSIYCLQETHFSEEIHSLITSKWGYKAYFNSSTLSKKQKQKQNKKRLAILINNNFEFIFVNLVTGDKGDFMLLKLKINDQTFTLVNLRSSNKGDPDFYDRVMGELKNTRSQELILTGLELGVKS